MRNKNLVFFVQPNEASFIRPEKQMKTYMNRFSVVEDDQVSLANVYVTHTFVRYITVYIIRYIIYLRHQNLGK